VTLNDPELVRAEYASEAGLLDRRSIYENRVGPDPRDVLWDEIVAAAPRRVLEVWSRPRATRCSSRTPCDAFVGVSSRSRSARSS
jgi:hypothetical protein